jgi:hypothetical protein
MNKNWQGASQRLVNQIEQVRNMDISQQKKKEILKSSFFELELIKKADMEEQMKT